MDRKEQAINLHKHGFNCAQSVVCSFCNVMGADPVEAFRMSEALGFGMGTMGTCGAVSAMAIVAGLKISDGNLDHPGTKKESYQMMQTLIKEFADKNVSIICRELKGVDTGKPLRSCDGCITDAVELTKKGTDIVSYITIVGWVIALLCGTREESKFHLNQSLVLILANIIWGVIGKVLAFIPIIGWLAIPIGYLIIFVLWVMGLVYALQGQEKAVPLIGGLKILS